MTENNLQCEYVVNYKGREYRIKGWVFDQPRDIMYEFEKLSGVATIHRNDVQRLAEYYEYDSGFWKELANVPKIHDTQWSRYWVVRAIIARMKAAKIERPKCYLCGRHCHRRYDYRICKRCMDDWLHQVIRSQTGTTIPFCAWCSNELTEVELCTNWRALVRVQVSEKVPTHLIGSFVPKQQFCSKVCERKFTARETIIAYNKRRNRECLRKARQSLREIRRMLRNPMALHEASQSPSKESEPDRTSRA